MSFSNYGYVSYISQSKIGEQFLKGLREKKLKGTRCTKCNTLYFPPRANCTKECLTEEHIEWEELSGEGTILSFSEVHIPPAGFDRFAPYTVCVVDLKEGGRLVAWASEDMEEPKIGEKVKATSEVIEGDRVVYRLTRAEMEESPETVSKIDESEVLTKRLAGKVAIITGAGKGIGRAIALEYARAGAKVVAAARTMSDIESVVSDIEELGGVGHAISCDVSSVESVQRLVDGTLEKFGKIDILVNNAGISRSALIAKTTDDLWNSIININLKGTFNCMRAVIPHFMEKKPLGGKIVNFTSTAAKYGNVGQSAYSASKWGIIALSKTAARELARYRVDVNLIMPGFIETPMTADTPSAYKEQTVAQIPLMRTGKPTDVAKAAVFLASDDSDYMTGALIQVDGGLRM
ncbi:MAG: 3-oxoacyl-ACP reductase FabG [Candidatus Hodarchaeales archaeon]|jgi:3-oxoacyl-[acyl-carrier protein] reductase